MDTAHTVTQLLLQGSSLAILAVGIGIYFNLFRRVLKGGGKVRCAEFAFPDLMVTMVLGGFFAALSVFTFLSPAPDAQPIRPESILPGAFFFLILLLGVLGFLRFREISLERLFGFDRISIGRAFAIGAGLVLAAFPLIIAASALTLLLIKDPGEEQELVTLFREVASKADFSVMGKIFVAGVCVAPIAEEFLFRGYFYGVLKKYCGGITSGLLTAALFAAIHTNLASFPSLFILALCLTIAYESTGNILVPVAMHSLFNLSQLGYLYWMAVGK